MTILLLLLILLQSNLFFIQPSFAVKGRYEKEGISKKRLFVFGDSYADTGNWDQSAPSWKPPYGITFPGKPAGRFSDGHILTDYIASYLNITSPTPYKHINSGSELEFGVNFAFGGTGVFNTDISQPNITSQIDLFENLITQTKIELQSSVALVSLAGNDYSYYLNHGSSKLNLTEFTKSVVKQLVWDLKRIHKLGVQKIVFTAMEPLGCLPVITTFLGYKNCSHSINEISLNHNKLLQENVERLNKKTKRKQEEVFYMVDLYGAFLSTLDKHNIQSSGKLDSEISLKPCCEGIADDFVCGSNKGGEAKYTVCQYPNQAFFWDNVHLTQHGWNQVYNSIAPTLTYLF